MARYALSKHSFACETGNHAIFLDLKRNSYLAVSPGDVARLRDEVQGWPATTTDSEAGDRVDGEDTEKDRDIIGLLTKEGLLTADTSSGKPATPVLAEAPTGSWFGSPRAWPLLDAQQVRRYVSAWALTSVMLKTLPTSWIVRRIRRRKERYAPDAPTLDVLSLRRLLSIHLALQPVFYSREDACLRDSITLLEFLAYHRVYPTWVFGVRMAPFAAHCWVQQGSVVYTDSADHVRTFTPIMLV